MLSNALSSSLSFAASAVARKIIDPVHHDAVVHVGQVPCRVEHELAYFRHFGVHDFVPVVPWFVVILMHTCEVENHGDVVLGEVVVITSVVKAVGVIRCIVGVIQGEVGVRFVAVLADFVKL